MRYQLQDSTMIILQLLASYFILQNISKFSSASSQISDVNNKNNNDSNVHVLSSIKKGRNYSSSILKNFNPDLLFLHIYGTYNLSRERREIIRLPPHKAFHEFNYEPVLPGIGEIDQNTPESGYPDGDGKISDEKIRITSGNVPSRSGKPSRLPKGDRRGRKRKPTPKVISRSRKPSRVPGTVRRRTQRPRPTSQEHTGSTKGPNSDLRSQSGRLPSHKAFHDFHYQTVKTKPPDFREEIFTPGTTKSRYDNRVSTEKPESSRYPDTNNRRITHKSTPSRRPTRRLGTAKPVRIPSHKAFHDFHQQPVKVITHDFTTESTRSDEDDRYTTKRPQNQRKTKIPPRFPDGVHQRITERPRSTQRQTDSATRKITTTKPPRTSVRIPPHKAFHDFHRETIKIKKPDGQVSTFTPSIIHKPKYPDGDHHVVTSRPEIHRTARPRIPSQFPDENIRRGTQRPLRRRPTSSVTERPINQSKRGRIPPHKAFHDFHYQNIKTKLPDDHSITNRPRKVPRPRYPDGNHSVEGDIHNKTPQLGTPSHYPDGDHSKVTRRPSHGLTEFSNKRPSRPTSGRIPPHKAFHDFHYESVKDKTRELAPKVISRPRYPDGNHRILTDRPQNRRRIPKQRFPDSQQHKVIQQSGVTSSHELTDLVSRRPVTAKPTKNKIGIPPHKAFHEFHYETVNAQPSDSRNVTYLATNLSNVYNITESSTVEERVKPRFPDGYTDIPLIMIHGTERPDTFKSPNRRRGSKRPKSGSPLKRRRVNPKSLKHRVQNDSKDFPDIPSDTVTINPQNDGSSTSDPIASFRTIYPNGDYIIELEDSRINHRKRSRSGSRRFIDGKHVVVDRPRFSSGTDHRLIKKSPISGRQESSVTKAPIRFPPHEAFHAFHSEPVRPRIITPTYPGTTTGRTTKPTGRYTEKTGTPRVKTTKPYEKTTRPSRDKTTSFREKTTSTRPRDKTTRHREKTTRPYDKITPRDKTTRTTPSYDRTTKPRDKFTKATPTYDRTTKPREKTTRPTYEKTTPRDKTTRPTSAYDRTTKPRDKITKTTSVYDRTTRPRDRTTKTTSVYDRTTRPRDRTTRPTPVYDRTTRPREKITKTTTTYDKTTRPRDKTTRFREKTTRPYDKTRDKTTPSYDRTTKPRDKFTKSTPTYDRTTRPREKTTRPTYEKTTSRDKTTRPTPTYDRTTKPRDKITKTTSVYDRTTRPRDRTTKTTPSYDRTTRPRERTTKTTTIYDRTTRPRDRTTRPTPVYDRTTRTREKTTKPQEKTTRPVYDRTTKFRDKTTRPTKPARTTTDKVRTIPGEPDEGRFRTASPDGKKVTTERPIRFPPHKAFHEFHNEPVRVRNRYG